MTNELSLQRYQGIYVSPFIGQVLLIAVFSSPIFGGILFALRQSKLDLSLAFLSVLPAVQVYAVQTTRATLMFACILWCSGYFSCRVLLHGIGVRLFTKRSVFVALGVVVLLFVLFVVGQVLRYEEQSMPILASALRSPHLRGDWFGQISAFSNWFANSWYEHKDPTYGAFTVAGVFDLSGLREREMGLYRDNITVEPGASTNIYTVFRGLIQDFTLPGSLVILFGFGGIAGWAYYRVARGHIRFMPILIAFYAFASCYATSIFNYNSILFGWLTISIYLWVIKTRAQSQIGR